MNQNLYGLIRSRMPADLSRPLIETETNRIYSYAKMEETTGRYARLLLSRGLRPGDRLLAQTEKSPEALFLYLACLRAGVVYIPINPAYTRAEVDYFLGDADPGLFVCDPGREAEFASSTVPRLTLRGDQGTFPTQASTLAPDPAVHEAAAEEIAAILYTSGTTGRSKGAMLSHHNLASNALTLVEAWGFSDKDVLLHALPIFHTHGLFVASHSVLLSGASMLFLPKFDSAKVLTLLPRATVLMGVPTFYTRLLAESGLEAAARGIRLFISGSAPLLADTHKEFHARTGQAILERYGMTETTMITSNPLHGDRVPGSVGPPLPGVELRIDPASQVIEVRGPNVFQGYWRRPGRDDFREGFFITGDVGRIDERGYVHILGRAKDLIISGGFNVYPKEIETVIDAIPGVAESAVIGLPHPDFGEAVTAVVVRRPGSAAPDESAVLAACREILAGFKVPKHVYFVTELPRNTMGKVQKNLLREQFAGKAPTS